MSKTKFKVGDLVAGQWNMHDSVRYATEMADNLLYALEGGSDE